MPTRPGLSGPGTQVAAGILTLVGLVVTLAASSQQLPPGILLAPVAVGLAALVVRRSVDRAFVAGLVAIVLTPIYYGQLIPGTRLPLTPVVMVSLVLLPSAWARRAGWRPVALDVAVLGYVVVRSLSFLLNFDEGLGAVFELVTTVALPYVVGRLLLLHRSSLTPVSVALVASGALLAVVGLRERAGVPNPYFTLLTPAYQADRWAEPEVRLGGVRAEASFGHPIALSMFLALCVLLALALALSAELAWQRAALLAAGGLAAVALVATLSRGGLLLLAVSVPIWLLTQLRRVDRRRLRITAVAIAGLAVAFVANASTLQTLVDNSRDVDSIEASSARYRLQILELVREPEQFSFFGRASEIAGSVSTQARDLIGIGSIDNTYALLFLTNGAVTLLAFAVVVLLVFRVTVMAGLDGLERAWAIGLAAACLNLLTVALLTQYSHLFNIGLALLAGLAQRHGDRRRQERLARLRSPA